MMPDRQKEGKKEIRKEGKEKRNKERLESKISH